MEAITDAALIPEQAPPADATNGTNIEQEENELSQQKKVAEIDIELGNLSEKVTEPSSEKCTLKEVESLPNKEVASEEAVEAKEDQTKNVSEDHKQELTKNLEIEDVMSLNEGNSVSNDGENEKNPPAEKVPITDVASLSVNPSEEAEVESVAKSAPKKIATEELILEDSSQNADETADENKLQEDDNLVKIIQDAVSKTGELEPGEQIMILSTDEEGNTKKIMLTRAEADADFTDSQQVSDESGNIYIVETSVATEEDIAASKEQDTEEEEVVEDTNPKSKKTSQAKTRNIPSHVLGRNILNPSVDPFRNGKAPPKPRLGVKIPYRNLTSQIVSKQEITEEIISRSQRNRDNASGLNLFAKKLTQTLARKLGSTKDAASTSENLPTKGAKSQKPVAKSSNKGAIDNTELLAILESDEEIGEVNVKKGEVLSKDLERKIALKQLSELPEDPDPKKNPPKGRQPRKGKILPVPADDEDGLQFSVAVPLKTYTRKRKPSAEDSPVVEAKQIAPQILQVAKPVVQSPTTSTAYTTKSSRVIKRKVIWDPDEITPKKSISKPQPDANQESPTKKEVKKAEPAPKKQQAVAVVKTAEGTKKVTPKVTPVPEKKAIKKEVVVEAVEQEEEDDDEEDDDEEAEEEKPKVAPGTPLKPRRLNNEIAKLLQDEGAVNMLYSIKSEEASSRKPNRKSLESKTNEVLNHLQTSSDKVSPKSLRKKEGTPNTVRSVKKIMCPPTPSPISRHKSKDSNRSSIHSPPPSPGQSFSAESRIIRRHSSSSYSSMGEEDDEERKAKKMESRSRRKLDQATGESARKKTKKEVSTPTKNDGFEKLIGVKLNPSTKYTKYKTFKVFVLDKLVQIDVGVANEKVFITNELMDELKTILNDLEKDKNVNVVLLTSSGSAFCDGLDFKTLLAPKEALRKNLAKKMAVNVKEFLVRLAKFPKVLVAGIFGNSVGLGVTMLPLFDMVVANEKSTFHVPNASLGCIAEGGSLLLLPHLSQNVLISELLYNSQVLSSAEALKLGLATKVMPSLEFNKELLNNVKSVSDKSAQFMEATKKQLRQRMISDISDSLESDTTSLIQQWSSDECQKHFQEQFN